MTTSTYNKPLPVISGLNAPFWEAAKKHELRLQRCRTCGRFFYPASSLCPFDWSKDFEWAPVSGRGKVTSWVVFHQEYFPGFEPDLPYNVVQVELEEGPRILSNLRGVNNDEIRFDMPVEVWFDDVTAEVTLPKFRPRA